jgi:uncharacterized repeat protein (TIGR03803 family)
MSDRRFSFNIGSKLIPLAVVLLLLVVAPQLGLAQTFSFSVFYSFAGSPDGANPYFGSLVRDGKGNLYGTTLNGGTAGYGTVFEVSEAGKEMMLYSFAGPPDGAYPYGGLVRDGKGNLHGTTAGGGIDSDSCRIFFLEGCGTVFAVSEKGVETTPYRFVGPPDDGAIPYAGLVRDSTGNLYGTTDYGGGMNKGTVFVLTPSGVETSLYTFCSVSGCPDGAFPEGALFRDGKGDLYSTTNDGGSNCPPTGCGTVFELSSTQKETVLHSFGGTDEGSTPHAALIRGPKGYFYGTTYSGGAYSLGTVFELAKNSKNGWVNTLLYSFGGVTGDGSSPSAPLVLDKEGNFYGTTNSGGKLGYGTVFELSPEPSDGCPGSSNVGTRWCETVLYSFTGGVDGANPHGGLVLDVQGNLYGATYGGGNSNCSGGCGVVFKLSR